MRAFDRSTVARRPVTARHGEVDLRADVADVRPRVRPDVRPDTDRPRDGSDRRVVERPNVDLDRGALVVRERPIDEERPTEEERLRVVGERKVRCERVDVRPDGARRVTERFGATDRGRECERLGVRTLREGFARGADRCEARGADRCEARGAARWLEPPTR